MKLRRKIWNSDYDVCQPIQKFNFIQHSSSANFFLYILVSVNRVIIIKAITVFSGKLKDLGYYHLSCLCFPVTSIPKKKNPELAIGS